MTECRRHDGGCCMNAEEEVLAKFDRLGALLFARDPAVVEELWCDVGFSLYGSEEGETVETLAELQTLFQALFAPALPLGLEVGPTTCNVPGERRVDRGGRPHRVDPSGPRRASALSDDRGPAEDRRAVALAAFQRL